MLGPPTLTPMVWRAVEDITIRSLAAHYCMQQPPAQAAGGLPWAIAKQGLGIPISSSCISRVGKVRSFFFSFRCTGSQRTLSSKKNLEETMMQPPLP